jgi:hypothetical protein
MALSTASIGSFSDSAKWRLVLAIWVVASAATGSRAASAEEPEDDLLAAATVAAQAEPRAMEVRFNDDSRLKFTLVEERIEVSSRYGTLSVAAADIRKIDFALRLSDSTKKEIDGAISELESTDGQMRKASLKRLAALGPIAYPSLAKVAARGDNAVEQRAADIVAKLKENVDPQEFAPRELDVIQTVDSTISGHILTPTLKVRTAQFGELSLKIADARSLRWQGLVDKKTDADDKDALPDPGNLYNYPDRSGKPLKFRVTGRTDGFIWGTDVYTADSPLATAAVHSGVLKAGQTGVVKVRLVPGRPGYDSSTRNGVTSQDFGAFPEAFVFVK